MFSLFKPHLSDQDRLFLTRNLALLIRSGIPLTEALNVLPQQSPNPALVKIVKAVSQEVQAGLSLSDGLKKFPAEFNGFFISLVAAGELAGKLEQNLSFLSDELAKGYSLRQKVNGAMMYPGLVLGAVVIMSTYVSFFVLPKLVDFFSVFDFPLPLATRILLSFAGLMKDYGLLIGLAAILLSVGVMALIRLPKVVPLWHGLLLRIPVFGKLLQYQELAEFSRGLSVLLESGLPITKSLHVVARSLNNYHYQTTVKKIVEGVERGNHLGQLLDEAPNILFPPLVVKMVNVGEKTGKLDEVLKETGLFFESEVDAITKNLSTLLEPMMLLGIGLLVAFVAMAIIAPIYELTGSFHA